MCWKINFWFIFSWIVLPFHILTFADNLALLSGTLRTYQKAACDEEWMIMRCPNGSGTTMSIQVAQYGKVSPSPALCSSPSRTHSELIELGDPRNNVTCLWPTAIQTVVGLCQKRTSCKFQTSPRTFGGDPCPGSRKYVEVAYKCRPTEFKSIIGCENEVIQLQCNKSSRVAIYSANFGRTEYESIQCPQPKGVREETCLSSYATENVMQMCHGKRKCALGVDPSFFGNPCKPESITYLKVIFTCVPRKVLKEKGDLEPDEIYEDDNEDETNDPIGGVLEQPSIDSKSWASSGPKTTSKPHQTSFNESPESRNVQRDYNQRIGRGRVESALDWVTENDGRYSEDHDLDSSMDQIESNGKETHDGTPLVTIISQGIQAYDFISKNPEKFYLYVAISVASGLLMLVILLLLKIWIQRNPPSCGGTRCEGGERGGGTHCSSKPSSSSVGPLTSGLSDIDELSVVMDPSSDIGDLHSILRHSSPREELFPLATTSSTTISSTLGRGGNEVVRFSNNLIGGRHSEESDTNPRSLNPNRDSGANIHFYYG